MTTGSEVMFINPEPVVTQFWFKTAHIFFTFQSKNNLKCNETFISLKKFWYRILAFVILNGTEFFFTRRILGVINRTSYTGVAVNVNMTLKKLSQIGYKSTDWPWNQATVINTIMTLPQPKGKGNFSMIFYYYWYGHHLTLFGRGGGVLQTKTEEGGRGWKKEEI